MSENIVPFLSQLPRSRPFFIAKKNNFSFLYKKEKSAGTIGEHCPSFCESFARTIDGILARIVCKMKKTVNQKVVKSSTREFTCSPLIRRYLRCLASWLASNCWWKQYQRDSSSVILLSYLWEIRHRSRMGIIDRFRVYYAIDIRYIVLN